MAAKKILIALTNHATLGNTGKPTGFWLSELTHPFFVSQRGGFGIDLISRKAAWKRPRRAIRRSWSPNGWLPGKIPPPRKRREKRSSGYCANS